MSEERLSRRRLVLAASVGACALAGTAAAPTLALVVSPLQARGGGAERWLRATRLDQLPEGEPRRVAIVADRRDAWTVERDVELGSVWLVRRGNEVVAFSSVCPHLGCSVNAAPGGSGFACPCHTSAFDADGRRTQGPSPRDLDRLATKVEEGHVLVDFRRFRIGIEEKVET
jgi:cytochrome b6-f complex iron-sulfur subunit/menaquinol-cytochrome c reductase iron-sulfur subunit